MSQKASAAVDRTGHKLSVDGQVELSGKPASKASKENVPADTSSSNFSQKSSKELPKYSYKNYKPSPARVYVRHLEEADDLVASLSG